MQGTDEPSSKMNLTKSGLMKIKITSPTMTSTKSTMTTRKTFNRTSRIDE
jgi:hypothetical protein